VAEQLALQSEAIADAIEHDDGCAATDRATELKATLDEAAGRGEVPETIRQEVARIVNREFTCDASPPAPPPPPPPPSASTDEEEEDD
jgi:hypothetical protein